MVPVLGVVQIFAWGSSYYLLAVLAEPIAKDTGWPMAWVVGALSLGLLTAGAVSPRVGDAIAEHGGRPVLTFACTSLAVGLAILAVSSSLPLYLFGWVILGVGMGAGLYDAAFASLAKIYGSDARSAITAVTLWGGFASTACWPLSALLVEHVGWRGACVTYATILLGICVPLILWKLPSVRLQNVGDHLVGKPAIHLTVLERRQYHLFAAIQIITGMFVTIVAVHLLTLLQARGLSLAEAVAFGAFIGPAQVAARVGEMAGRGRHHPLWTLSAAVGLCASGLVLLAIGSSFVGLALILYGAGNGIFSIAKGALPLSFFGADRYGPLMGRLARPGLIAQAIAPPLGAVLISLVGGNVSLYALAALAAANIVLLALLWMTHRRP